MTQRRVLVSLLVMILIGSALVSCGQRKVDPPVAKIDPKVDTMFGVELVDNYYWLRERENPDVIDYLKAENEYALAKTAHLVDLQDKLYEEMVGRIKETDLSVPVRLGDYDYYSREDSGKQYKTYCRRPVGSDEEQILLDVNKLAEGHDYMLIGGLELSPDQSILAYAYDTAGREEYTVQFRDLKTGEKLADVIEATDGDVVWANDNKTVFYATQDPETLRPNRAWRYKLGQSGQGDEIYFEADERFYLGLGRSRSDKFVYIVLGSAITSEYRYIDANKPDDSFKVLLPREQGVEYSVAHHGNDFYIVTNADSAINFKLIKAPTRDPSKKNWTVVLPHRPDVMLSGILMFADHMAIRERQNGLQVIQVMDMKTGDIHAIEFDEAAYSVSTGSWWSTSPASDNADYNTNLLRFTYESLVTPEAVYDYNMATKERKLKKQKEVLGGYDASDYTTERIFATAYDGEHVPIILVYRTDMFKGDGTNPCYLYGYGAYGSTEDPWFSTSRPSLLDRGFVFAVAQVRGGGEMGRMWYENGKFLKKKNTFTDFIACGNYLVEKGYTSHDKMAIGGGSAGGLLIGAVVNMAPELAEVAVADVPFVDVLNTMLDETIPLTAIEWEEWGNPKDEEYFHYMRSYSPYDNVEPKTYPHMLITAGLNDPRVQYWEPAKWTAKLRATKTDTNDLLFKTVMEGGHFGQSGRYSHIREVAFEWAFVLDKLGVTD